MTSGYNLATLGNNSAMLGCNLAMLGCNLAMSVDILLMLRSMMQQQAYRCRKSALRTTPRMQCHKNPNLVALGDFQMKNPVLFVFFVQRSHRSHRS